MSLQPGSGTVGITTSNADAFGKSQTPLPGATVGDDMIINAFGEQYKYWSAWA